MRVVKEAQKRKDEILDCAVRLFMEKGYDSTTVTDIMNEVGIAKGTLYYHFKSKEEILDGILNRMFVTHIERANRIADDTTLGVHEKLRQALLSLQIREDGATEVFEEVHKPQNALMHQKMLQRMMLDVTPVLARIIEEGIEAGVFYTRYPYESAELFVTYGNIVFDGGFLEFNEDEIKRKIIAFVTSMERVLGAPEGSMAYVYEMFIE